MTDPRKPTFDAIREIVPGKALSQEDVTTIHEFLDGLGAVKTSGGKARALRDPAAFFASLRASFGPLSQSQVDGFNRLLSRMGTAGWSTAWTAYGLATPWHETGTEMQPVREAPRASEAWRKKNLRYWPWYGRGDVQTTWERNYRHADAQLGLGGTLIANPDRMLEPAISADTLVHGMAEGWFSGKKLGDYLPDERGTTAQFTAARPIINVHDRDALIAGYADKIQAALIAGGWA